MAEGIKKILHVDDEPDIVYIIEFILTNGGFKVTKLTDSTKTISELLSDDYSLLILDLMMPKMDGFTILKLIRDEAKLKNLPVLILSSRYLSNDETEFLQSMSAYVMAKPFEPYRMLDKVREIITD